MTYAKYREDMILRVNDNRWINPNDPLCADDYAAYQAWVAAGNTPLDGNAGCPGIIPSKQIGLLDYKLARIGEDLINVLLSKGVLRLTDLPAAVQTILTERQQLRQKIANE